MCDDWSFCQTKLRQVSRTFALNIQVLRGDLAQSVLLAYLWCRIIDTVEDAPAFPPSKKVEALHAFANLILANPTDDGACQRWAESLVDLDGRPEELELVHSSDRVARCYAQLPDEFRNGINPSVAEMARGMALYLQRSANTGACVLEDVQDLEQYCYYVAGTVGEFLTRLFAMDRKLSPQVHQRLQARAVSFGLGLQMTNIAKDVMTDIDRGWCYIPRTVFQGAGVNEGPTGWTPDDASSRHIASLMVQIAKKHLRSALEYVLILPRTCRRIRLFCIWPLWMALETLKMLDDQHFAYSPGTSPKISRKKVRTIIRNSSLLFWSNRWLQKDFDRRFSRDTGFPDNPDRSR